MLKVGIIGWRGMVGSVLIQRMHEENDFESIDAHFFSTSQSGGKVRILKSQESTLLDAFDADELIKMDILLSCQGGDYTLVWSPDGHCQVYTVSNHVNER